MASDRAHRQANSLAADAHRLTSLFGTSDLLPLWIAEPYVDLAPEIRETIERRARTGWYGYETRPQRGIEAFWDWMLARHGWERQGLTHSVSPSVGTSIGVLIDRFTDVGDGVIIQPPVFTDFKPLIRSANRSVIRNPLVLEDGVYRMDLESLEKVAAEARTKLMILCNPHNPVGRTWTRPELEAVAQICAANDVLVVSDEIHADLVLRPHRFTPFGVAASDVDVRWAATHGPIKTFGLAGVCDTVLITDDEVVVDRFREVSSRLHLTRNNVFSIAAFETAYRTGGEWLDRFLRLVASNAAMLEADLTEGISTITPQATFLAWLDFRSLGLDVPELAEAIAQSGVALSPGHWFGREGAGFGRLTIAADEREVATAIERINRIAPR